MFHDDFDELSQNNDDFEFHRMKKRSSLRKDAEELLLEIGQKLFKHNYMMYVYYLPVFGNKVIVKLMEELQALIRCCPASPSGIFLSNNITCSETLVDINKLFNGKWEEEKGTLDFIGKFKDYHLFVEVEEDDIYENMFR